MASVILRVFLTDLILSLSALVLPSMTIVLVRGATALEAELMGAKAIETDTITHTSTTMNKACILEKRERRASMYGDLRECKAPQSLVPPPPLCLWTFRKGSGS
jgi:hypothetical protein